MSTRYDDAICSARLVYLNTTRFPLENNDPWTNGFNAGWKSALENSELEVLKAKVEAMETEANSIYNLKSGELGDTFLELDDAILAVGRVLSAGSEAEKKARG